MKKNTIFLQHTVGNPEGGGGGGGGVQNIATSPARVANNMAVFSSA